MSAGAAGIAPVQVTPPSPGAGSIEAASAGPRNVSFSSTPAPSTPSKAAGAGGASAPSSAVSEEDAALIAKEERMTPAERIKRDELRAQVIGEIQSTERSYVQALDALQSCFVAPLKERMASNKAFSDIGPAAVENMCSNLETLTNFHHMFIQSLEKVQPADGASASAVNGIPSPTSPTSIPALFLRFTEFFRLYIPYLNGYERSLNTFNELRKHKKFAEWLAGDVRSALKAFADSHRMPNLDLLSYMIQPVQRVPRYVLLLKELKRQTSPSHPEFASLGEALAAVQRVASVINEGQRTVENMSKLMAVQQRIVGEFETLIQPHRRLIREGTVTATYQHGMFSTLRTRKSVFFLFSDILLWTSEEFKFKGSIDLTPAKLAPKSPTSFVIDTATKVLQVALDTPEETKSWFEAIDAVVATLQNEREKLRQRARVQKARNLNGTANKDAIHKLVTQSLQGLTLQSGQGDEASSAADGGAAAASAFSAAPAQPATIGRGSTLGQRSGRKFEEALADSEAKSAKEQEYAAAHSREKLNEDTFAPPSVDEGGDAGSAAAAPAAASSAHAPVVVGGAGGSRYQARFVNRRGKSTLGKRDCLCTIILIHAECPKHGVEAQRAAEHGSIPVEDHGPEYADAQAEAEQ